MSIEKSRLRAAALFEVAAKIEEMFEASKFEFKEIEGGRGGIALVAKKLEEHTLSLDKVLMADNSTLQKEEYDIAKKYIAQCIGIARNLLAGADDSMLRSQGKVGAIQAAFKVADSFYKIESGKITQFAGGIVEDSGEGLPGPSPSDGEVLPFRRVEGQHPGDPLAARRAESQPIQDQPPIPAPQPPQEEVKSEVAPTIRKRGRPRKNV